MRASRPSSLVAENRDSTPPVTFSKGRLTKVENSVSKSEVLGYDAFGRVLKSRQTTDSVPYLFGTTLENGYEYTQSDGLKTVRYPSGRVVNMGYHNNGWLKTVSGSLNGQAKNSSIYAAPTAATPIITTPAVSEVGTSGRTGSTLAPWKNATFGTPSAMSNSTPSVPVWPNLPSGFAGPARLPISVEATMGRGQPGKGTGRGREGDSREGDGKGTA